MKSILFHFGRLAFLAHHLSAAASLVAPSATSVYSAGVQKSSLRGQGRDRQSLLRYQDGGLDSGNMSQIDASATALNSRRSNSSYYTERRIFFLFLTLSGIKRPELWQAFFEGQPSSQYRVFVHCKHSNICALEFSLGNILGATQVPTVPSTYCKDLVTPMVQLLQSAVTESSSPGDKFVFLSETTLPVKPFQQVYSTLMWDENSDFCIYPTDHWVELDLVQNLRALIVKHSQWVVLNQAHAQTLVNSWPAIKQGMQESSWSVPVYAESKKGPWGKITNPAGVLPLPMCLDEWAIFATLYGAFVDRGQWTVEQDGLPGSSAPLHFRGSRDLSARPQGVCRTFAFWDATEFDGSNLVNEIKQDWPWSKLSCFPKCDSSHPAEFTALSDRGATALRQSRYLFARKFDESVITMDQFRRIIIATR